MVHQGATLVYWHHNQSNFDWLIQEDQSFYHVELTNICRNLREGFVTSVAAGKAIFVSEGTVASKKNEFISIDGSQLYTMKVINQDQQGPVVFFATRSRSNR